jgi:hypothetical protein
MLAMVCAEKGFLEVVDSFPHQDLEQSFSARLDPKSFLLVGKRKEGDDKGVVSAIEA